MARLEELRGEFAEHDAFLHLLLGLVSVSRRLEPVLPAVPPRMPEVEPAQKLSEEQEQRVLALLGLLSLRRTLLSTLAPLRTPGPGPVDAVERPHAELPPLRDLLR